MKITLLAIFFFFQQVQEELRSVRTQLDEILNLGQELVSKSEKYRRLGAPDIETITRKFEELQRRIQIIQVGVLLCRTNRFCFHMIMLDSSMVIGFNE